MVVPTGKFSELKLSQEGSNKLLGHLLQQRLSFDMMFDVFEATSDSEQDVQNFVINYIGVRHPDWFEHIVHRLNDFDKIYRDKEDKYHPFASAALIAKLAEKTSVHYAINAPGNASLLNSMSNYKLGHLLDQAGLETSRLYTRQSENAYDVRKIPQYADIIISDETTDFDEESMLQDLSQFATYIPNNVTPRSTAEIPHPREGTTESVAVDWNEAITEFYQVYMEDVESYVEQICQLDTLNTRPSIIGAALYLLHKIKRTEHMPQAFKDTAQRLSENPVLEALRPTYDQSIKDYSEITHLVNDLYNETQRKH